MRRSLDGGHEPADDVERGLLGAAQDVDDVPLLLSRSPSAALPPGGGSPAALKCPPSSMGSGSDLSIELTMPLPADSRNPRYAPARVIRLEPAVTLSQVDLTVVTLPLTPSLLVCTASHAIC